MQVKLDKNWTITFTPDEMRLIVKALGVRLKPEDIERAKQLGAEIAVLRCSEAKGLYESMEKHMKAAIDDSAQ